MKIYIVSVTSEKIRYFFTVEKYKFYSHLICIEFTACDKGNTAQLVIFQGRSGPLVAPLDPHMLNWFSCDDVHYSTDMAKYMVPKVHMFSKSAVTKATF